MKSKLKREKGLVFVVSAPAGTGKTTLVRMLCDEFSTVVTSVSSTTRAPRAGEEPGRDYFFLSNEEFKTRVQRGDFLEYAEVFKHCYGTSKEYVLQEQEKGHHVFLVIDTQGAMQLREKKFPAVFIFISPPSLEELKDRLVKRQTETEEMLEHRHSSAEEEMALADKYDYHIVNDDLHHAYDALRSILIAEQHRIKKRR